MTQYDDQIGDLSYLQGHLAEATKAAQERVDGSAWDEPVPDGDYICTIVKAQPKMSKTGRPQVSQQLRIEEGRFAGQMLFRHSGLDPQGLSFYLSDLIRLGLKVPQSANDLAGTAALLPGIRCRVTQKSKVNDAGKTNVNVYLNGLAIQRGGEHKATTDDGKEVPF